jgi:uncharacterized protein
MRMVLDTNVLLVAIPKKSKFRPIFDAILNGKVEICFTTEILNEYAEKIEEKANSIVSNNVVELLLNLENAIKVEVYIRWLMIEKDMDDNKFSDCAVAAGIDYLVSDDSSFRILKTRKYPPIRVLTAEDFLSLLEKNDTL